MYNYYLEQTPIDVTPNPPSPPTAASAHSNSLLSLLSRLGQGGGLPNLFSEENLIVLAALAFLTYGEDGLDGELFALAVLFLLIGL